MNKVLDLSCFVEETLELILIDGKHINIPKPTQKMAIALMSYGDKMKSDKEHAIDHMNELVTAILNTNKQGRKFTKDNVSELTIDTQAAIIRAYNEFLNELVNNPN